MSTGRAMVLFTHMVLRGELRVRESQTFDVQLFFGEYQAARKTSHIDTADPHPT